MNKSAYAAPRCPGTLKEGYNTYSPAFLKRMFEGRKIFHVLPANFDPEEWQLAEIHGQHFGEQKWYRMGLNKNELVPDEHGSYILKTTFPGSSTLRFQMEQAGNEHLCMQLAKQVFQLPVIENGIIFFPDGQPALICKSFTTAECFTNFDVLQKQNNRLRSMTSYVQMSQLIESSCAAVMIAKEHFFRQVIFSWLIANGNAHAKLAGVIKTTSGDYTPSPLFSAMCTRLHELGFELAMPGGFFDGDKSTPDFRENGHYTRSEIESFANRIGLMHARTEKILNGFISGKDKALALIQCALLPEEAKAIIRFNFMERISRLR